jgi:hypothetical protein
MAMVGSEHEALALCALRMNGYLWAEQRGIDPYAVPSRYPEQATTLLESPVDEQMAIFFILQRADRFDMEAPRGEALALWRRLFLTLCEQSVPPEYATDYGGIPVLGSTDQWEKACRPYLPWLRQIVADRLRTGTDVDQPLPPVADSFIDWLDLFNRKERYFVFAAISDQERIGLAPGFRRRLSAKCGIEIPESARAYVDYHLDWVHAATILPGVEAAKAHDNQDTMVATGSQEDIDLLVAFRQADRTVVLLVEAKGVTSWGNAPLQHKARRLRLIFGDNGNRVPGVEPKFLLLSPNPPQKLNCVQWPEWMRPDGAPVWLKLDITTPRMAVFRSDNSGKARFDGGYWSVSGAGTSLEDDA